MKTAKLFAVCALVAFAAACNPFAPELPPQVIVNNNSTLTNNNIIGTPLPTGSPSPAAPGAGDKVITSLKCTESGGDGERQFSVGEKLTLTCTPFNAAGKDPCTGIDLATCGAYTAADIAWEALEGVSQDASGVVQALNSWSNGYNYDFKALKAGTFKVRGKFKGGKAAGGLESEFVGQVK